MSEVKTVDARGLSCPQPVMLANKAINELQKGTFEVLVDSGTARDNVSRLAKKHGWAVKIEETESGVFRMVLQK
jgi:TusA-related sulfurtransferase